MLHTESARLVATPGLVQPVLDMLTSITGDLVGDARKVSAEVIFEGGQVRFLLWVSPADLNRVLGPRGRTAASLRIILRAAGIKQGCRFSLSIKPLPTETNSPADSLSALRLLQ